MSEWIWPYIAVTTLALARLLVPPERWRELFVSALLGGFSLTFPVQYLFGVVLGAWTHHYPFWNVLDVPVWLAVAWFGETLIFLHYLPQRMVSMLVYITAFAVATAAMGGIMAALGVRPLLGGWTVIEMFILGFVLHFAIVGIDFMIRGASVANKI